MIATDDPVHSQPLPGGLTLRTAAGPDVDRLAAFNGLIHGGDTVEMTRRLLLEHPRVTGRDFIFVEDGSGRILSSICVIPWTWSYAGTPLPVGEMGIVGTLEECRGHGLIRAQVEFFRQRLAERGCLLSIIQGIPFFYRQFGYEYALPLEAAVILELRRAPAPSGAAAAAVPGPEPAAEARPRPPFTFRRATCDDVPVLARFYDEAVRDVAIHAVRDEAVWRYLLAPYAVPDGTSRQTWLVEDAAGVCGYFRVAEYHFHDELTVDEASALPYEAGVAVLAFLKELASRRNEPGIRLNLPSDHNLVRLALAFGGYDRGAYSWQLMIPSIPALLRGLAPALEARLAASPLFAGLTREVRISFYRQAFAMRFRGGKLVEVSDEALDDDSPSDVRMPIAAFTPLVAGCRSIEQLRELYPDLGARGVSRVLLDTLFPPCGGFIYTTY